MWFWLWETASNIALGVFATCTVMGCNITEKPHNVTGGGTVRPPIARPAPAEKGRVIVASGSVGKGCFIEARANGEVFPMLLDTGSTGSAVTFGSNHLERLGIDADTIKYDRSFNSANGTGKQALVTLREFRIGDSFVIRNLPVDITQAPQKGPFVGVELLHRLNLRLKDGKCILTLPSEKIVRVEAARTTRDMPHPSD
jgi:clan AA aspartic protease (TIGR02281 family)